MKVAFYKAKYGNWSDKLIAWWTKSEYSHVEVIVDGVWYSSSPRDGKVRSARIEADEKWDFIAMDGVDNMAVVVFAVGQMSKRYDWLGIVMSQVLPLKVEDPDKWFCSEFCSRALKEGGYVGLCSKDAEYSPGDLYEVLSQD